MKELSLKTVIWKEGKYYVAQCLNVDVSSFGKTRNEALSNIHEALVLYFDGKIEGKKGVELYRVERPEVVALPFLKNA